MSVTSSGAKCELAVQAASTGENVQDEGHLPICDLRKRQELETKTTTHTEAPKYDGAWSPENYMLHVWQKSVMSAHHSTLQTSVSTLLGAIILQ